MTFEKVKNIEIEFNGEKFARIPVKTKVIVKGDDIAAVVSEYVLSLIHI